MVAAGLSFQAALAAGFFGTMVALVFYLIMATLGVDYAIPGQVATRVVYGLRGAKLIPSLLRVLVSIYWFSFQTLVGASAIVAVLAKMTGITYPLGQRDLRIDPGVRRGDRLRIAQGADARRLADEGHRVGLSICSVRAS